MYDSIIRGGRVIDGSGSPWYYGDIGIRDHRIAHIGKLDQAEAHQVLDADNHVVCPGFIDMHSHSDLMLLANPMHEPKVMQGVTTELLGLDGLSYAPLSSNNLKMMLRYLSGLNGNPGIAQSWSSVSEYLALFDHQVAVNVVYLVPHNALRLEVIGFTDRFATSADMVKMQDLIAEGLNEGAIGFSTGLDYFPAGYSDTEELIRICEIVARYNGVSVWHTRQRDLGLIEAINEVINVAEKTNVKVHFSHYSVQGQINHGKSEEMLTIIDRARERGFDITFDSYPYIASSTTMIALLPRWVHENGPDSILERLADPVVKGEICESMRATHRYWDRFVIASVVTDKNKTYIGKNILEASNIARKEVNEFICDLLLEEELDTGYIGFLGNEEDLKTIMKHPCHMAGSDGLLVGDKPNPRAWGTFARYLGVYSRELSVLSLEEVIRHMTAAPAQCLGLSDRGLVKEGLAADLVIFNPDTIIDNATFDEPKMYPTGIQYVLVNGAIVVNKGAHTGDLKGRVLLRK